MGHNNSKLFTTEERLCRSARDGNLDELKLLLAPYPNLLNCRHPRTRVPLSYCTCAGYVQERAQLNCLEFIISQGCSLSDVDENEKNIISYALGSPPYLSGGWDLKQTLVRGRSKFRASLIALLACRIHPVESLVCDYFFSTNIMEWTAESLELHLILKHNNVHEKILEIVKKERITPHMFASIVLENWIKELKDRGIVDLGELERARLRVSLQWVRSGVDVSVGFLNSI